MVLEYMHSHEAYLNHGAFVEDELVNTFQKCKQFVEFCDKYDVCEAASAVSFSNCQVHCLNVLGGHEALGGVLLLQTAWAQPLMSVISGFWARKLLDVDCYEELHELMEDNNIAGPITKSFLSTRVVHKTRGSFSMRSMTSRQCLNLRY